MTARSAFRPSTRTGDTRRLSGLSLALRVLGVALALILLAVAGFLLWALTPHRANETALAAMESDGQVTVTEGTRRITFYPNDELPTVALVLYPGGRVEAEVQTEFISRYATALLGELAEH